MMKLVGDLFLGLKFVILELILTLFIDFLYKVLGKLRSKSLGLKGSNKMICIHVPLVNLLQLAIPTKMVNGSFNHNSLHMSTLEGVSHSIGFVYIWGRSQLNCSK